MQQIFPVIILCLQFISSETFAYDTVSPPITYLHNGEHQIVYLTSISPTLICLQQQHWLFWIYQAFQSQVFTVNTSSQKNPFPVHVFLASNEKDLRSRSPWIHHIDEKARHAVFSLLSTTNYPVLNSFDNFEVFENTQIPLYDLHAHCVALLPSTNNRGPSKLNIGFDSQLDIGRLARFGVGLIIYTFSSYLAHNLAFYYVSGVSMSVLGSFLILIILAMRIFPKRTSLIMQGAVLMSGGALSLIIFCLDYIQLALWTFVINNVGLLIAYVGIISLLSAIVLYWLSLPETVLTRFPRTQTLILLVLRLIGILFITSAPQLPDNVHIVNTCVLWVYGLLGINSDAYLISKFPLFNRILFGVTVVLLLYCLSNLFETNPTMKKQSTQKGSLPPIPCAASSPCPWRPSIGEGYYHDGESVNRRREGYGDYWDMQALSPVPPNNTSRGYLSQSFGYRSPAQKKSRKFKYNGSVEKELLTDDEEDYD